MVADEYVRSVIRWRPTDEKENVIIKKVNENVVNLVSQQKMFCFDHVIDSSDQKTFYDNVFDPLVEKALLGYDCTFVASGQSGTGKTYTMGLEADVNSENRGMIQRAVHAIFSYSDAKQVVDVWISFVEVYNDQAFDLLGPNPREPFCKKVKMSQSTLSTRKSVQNEKEVSELLAQCTKNRHVRGTKMNAKSSRSHAVCTIALEIKDTEDGIRKSVINIVDLAGSECVSKTGYTAKESTEEGKKINESLSAFKRVIIAIASGANHIPFRDSVVTHILRASLKTQCYLTLLGCVSPFVNDSGETLSTLNFVSEAKLIKRTPQLNAVINKFQSFKTPAKTPNCSVLRSMQMSEPHNRPIISNLSTLKRFRRKSISTTKKKMGLSSTQNIFSPIGANRSRVVNKLFRRKPTRKALASLENNELQDLNFSVVTMLSESLEIDSPKKLAETQTSSVAAVDQFIENFVNEAKMVKGLNFLTMKKLLAKTRTELNVENSTITGSFHLTPTQITMQQTVTENEFSGANSSNEANKNDDRLKNVPMEDQNSSVKSIIDLITSPNVSIKCNHADKKILFEVNEVTGDDVTVTIAPSAQIVSPHTTKATNVLKCDDSYIGGIGGDSDAQFQVEPSNQTHRFVDHRKLLAKTRTELNVENSTITGSFHLTPTQITMQQTVTENEFSRANSSNEANKNDDTLKNVPMEDQNSSVKSVIDLITSPNESIKCNHADKKILFEVNEATGDDVTVTIAPSAQIVSPHTTKATNVLKCDDSFIGGIGGDSDAQFQVEPSNQTHRFVDHMLGNTSMVKSGPIIKNPAEDNVPIPVGRLIIQVSDSWEFDNTQYTVEMVRKVRRPQEIITERSPYSFRMEMEYDNEAKEMPNNKPFPTSPAIASKATHNAHHTSSFPRLVLHRVNTMDDYHKHYGKLQQYPSQSLTKTKPKVPRIKSARTKNVAKISKERPKETDLKNKILHILKTGSEKELQSLGTIGAKKASQIFNYRNAKGEFKTLEGLLKMPFWSKKMHERFIANNIFF